MTILTRPALKEKILYDLTSSRTEGKRMTELFFSENDSIYLKAENWNKCHIVLPKNEC